MAHSEPRSLRLLHTSDWHLGIDLGSESKMVLRPCGSRTVTISPGGLW